MQGSSGVRRSLSSCGRYQSNLDIFQVFVDTIEERVRWCDTPITFGSGFGRFTSKFVDFLDQKWTPKMDSFRSARRATLPCGCNLVKINFHFYISGLDRVLERYDIEQL